MISYNTKFQDHFTFTVAIELGQFPIFHRYNDNVVEITSSGNSRFP